VALLRRALGKSLLALIHRGPVTELFLLILALLISLRTLIGARYRAVELLVAASALSLRLLVLPALPLALHGIRAFDAPCRHIERRHWE